MPVQYRDIDLDFLSHPVTGDVAVLEQDAAIKRAVRHLILTSFYEKPFHPEIGCRISHLLFEPISNLTVYGIQKSVQEMLDAYEPRIELVDVKVKVREEQNSYAITIEYNIIGYSARQATTLYVERTR